VEVAAQDVAGLARRGHGDLEGPGQVQGRHRGRPAVAGRYSTQAVTGWGGYRLKIGQ
jgi:hypothetical protein